jgi:hypothetical protein
MWTHGYDFYTMTKPWVSTYYGGDKKNKGSFSASPDEYKVAQTRTLNTRTHARMRKHTRPYMCYDAFTHTHTHTHTTHTHTRTHTHTHTHTHTNTHQPTQVAQSRMMTILKWPRY